MRYTEKLRTKVSHSSLKYGVMAITCLGLIFAKDAEGTRNLLPEPFDFFDHAGNVNGSAQLGYVAGWVSGALYVHSQEENPTPPSIEQTRKIMAIGALATGVVINLIAESKFGINFANESSTSDNIDFVYGVAAATLAGALLPNVEQVREVEIDSYQYNDRW